MKKIVIIALTLSFTLSFYSCDEALDINRDPLAATEANPNAVLPFVFAEYSARKTTELGTRIPDVFQHVAHTFNSPKNGTISIFLSGNTWNTWYTALMGNLTLLEQDAAAAGETSNNVQAVAKILKAHLFFELSMIWEDVPYTEALDGENFPEPQFDSQETILRGVIQDFQEAIALIDAMPADGNFNFAQGDLLLGGDISRWRDLANSMIVRVGMVIRNQDPSIVSTITAAYADGVIDEPVFLQYAGGSGADNGIYDLVNAFFGPSNEAVAIYGPSEVLRDQLRDTNDPRLTQWVVDPTGGNYDNQQELGLFPTTGVDNVLSDNLIRGDYPDIWFLPSELDLYAAELLLPGGGAASGVSGYTTAQAAFEQGTTYACGFWSGNGTDVIDGYTGTPATSGEIAAFVAGLGAVSLENIGEQLWLEAWFRPVMAWTHVRRNDVPALSPPGSASIATILKRFDYPPNEVAANPNTPAIVPTDDPMWFEDNDGI